MADFFEKKDINGITDFADPDALFDFGFEASEQLVFNESPSVVIEVSFDGTNIHAELDGGGPTKSINWSGHKRRKLFVRRQGAAGPPSVDVQVMANRE